MTIAIENLNQADRVLHSLAQLIALTGTNCLPPQPDDSQANIGWNADLHRLEGRPFAVQDQSIRLTVDLPTFSLHFLDGADQPVASFRIENRAPAEAMAWWQTVLQGWNLTTAKPLNYQLGAAPVATETPYTRPQGLTDWANWRTTADEQLTILNALSGRESDVRIWPHHFDTGVYYSLPDETGTEQAAIWAGYGIADAVSSEPYFYLSGYNSRQAIDFSAATALTVGKWLVTPDWQGACLPVSDVAAPEQITRFFGESYAWLAAKLDEQPKIPAIHVAVETQ